MTGTGFHGVGAVIDGKYLLEAVLGDGGMGTVYRATHLTLDSPVAVKVLRGEFSMDAGYRKRFEREARVLSRLRHPSAVQVYDFGVHDDMLFLVMEYVDGVSLRRVLREHGQGRIPYGRIHGWATALTEVLLAAHQVPLVHRDLKPENILLTTLGSGGERLVVVDFGLAFVVDSGELGRMTESGIVVGTPMYVSPEQAEGGEVTTASDMYALGCVLYEICTGRPPFVGKSTVKVLNSHLFLAPRPLSEEAPGLKAPERFKALVMALLRKAPAERPNAAEALEVLRACSPTSTTLSVEGMSLGVAPAVESHPSGFYTQETVGPMRTAVERPQVEPTVLLPREAPTVGEARVGFSGHPIRADWIEPLRARGLSCHLYQAGGDYSAVFAPRARGQELRSLAAEGVPVVVACSGEEVAHCLTELLHDGAADVVQEPVEVDELVNRLARLVRRVAVV